MKKENKKVTAKTTAKKTTSKKSTSKKVTTAKTTSKAKAPATKTAPKKSTVKKAASTQATTKPGEYMLRRSGLDKEGNQKFTAIRVYKRKPNGWREDNGATTAPVGYKWINNGKSLTSGERKTALVKVKQD